MKQENKVTLSTREQRWLQRGESLGEQLVKLRKKSKDITETLVAEKPLQENIMGNGAASAQHPNKS